MTSISSADLGFVWKDLTFIVQTDKDTVKTLLDGVEGALAKILSAIATSNSITQPTIQI